MSSLLSPRSPGSLEVRGLARRFGSLEVLRATDRLLDAGQIVSVVGRNGAGKTTLLRLLAGVLDPSAGDVFVSGRPVGRGLASFVPSGDRMLSWRLTGRKNPSFFARLGGSPRADLAAAVAAAATALDADELLDGRSGLCSTGQRRRLMLAVGFVTCPPVVLLDEPYADLDDEGCAVVAALCRRWAEAGGLVVYASPQADSGPEPDLVLHLREGDLEAARR